MTIRYLRNTALLCLAPLASGCGWLYNGFGPYPPRVVSTENSGAEVRLSHGQQLFVRLPFKAEAGYEWTLREPPVAAVKPEGAPAQDKETGTEVWTFTPVRDGEQTLRLEYRRADDSFTAPAGMVSYSVTVE
jgi:predicted secreted protein